MNIEPYTLVGAFVVGWVGGTGFAYKVFQMLMNLTDTKAPTNDDEGSDHV